MVKAEELRIGNKLMYKKYSYVTVESIGTYGINLECGDGGMYWDSYEDLEPILLTPEILEKAGFKSIEANHSQQFTKAHVLIEIVSYLGTSIYARLNWGKETPNLFLCKLEYVHQLQNLYFTLTGQELNINL